MGRLLIIITLFLATAISPFAQNPLIKQYTIKDGLPTNTVYYAYQDNDKFIWFATNSGAVRFNGKEFRTFNMDDGLNDNVVIRIKQDNLGRIWFFNLNGTVNYYFNNTIYNNANSDILKSIHSNYQILSFFEDKDSTLYFYNSMYDVFIVKPGQGVDRVSLGLYLHEHQTLLHLNKSSSGELLLWTMRNLLMQKQLKPHPRIISKLHKTRRVFPYNKNQCFTYNEFNELVLYSDTLIQEKFTLDLGTELINSVLVDKKGVIWIATFDKGVYCIKNKEIINHIEIDQAQAIVQDDDENIWVTSMKSGAYKINPYFHSMKHLNSTNFANKSVTVLVNSTLGGVWCTNGSEVYLIQNNNIYSMPEESNCNSVGDIHQLRNNTLLIGGIIDCICALTDVTIDQHKADNKIHYDNKIIHHDYFNKKIVVNKHEDEMASYSGNRILFHNPADNFIIRCYLEGNSRIRNIFYNNDNELIINANKNYIFQHDDFVEHEVLKPFHGQSIRSHLLLNDSCEILNLNGKNLYLQYKKKFFDLGFRAEHQHDYDINQLTHCGPHLFFSTVKNVYCIDNLTAIINNKPIPIRNLGIEFNNINDIEVNDSILYVASDEGVSMLPIKEFFNYSNILPKPYFNKILINDKETDFTSGKIYLSGENKLSILFSSINYSTSRVKYSYMMEGMDNMWNQGHENNVVFKNLPPGTYSFLLKSRLNKDAYSSVIKLAIVVKPGIFQRLTTWIAICTFIVLIIFIVYFYLKNKKLKQDEIEHQMISLEHKALQSMMNPHFIFNSLGSIQSYILQNKPNEAGLYLSQFARLIRQNMNSLKSNLICIEDETERLRNYLDLEKFRMNDKFTYSIDIDPKIDPDEVLIPSMMIQPFVENAIWHGISPIDAKGEINIRFAQADKNKLNIIIEDNGIGITAAKTFQKSDSHLNMGMELTKKRLEILSKKYNVKSGYFTSELYPGQSNPGTIITLVVPITFGETSDDNTSHGVV